MESGADVIGFDGQRLYEGICYHLSDMALPHWQTIRQFTPDSLFHMRHLLLSRTKPLFVPRDFWEGCNDEQRLFYLMVKAGLEANPMDHDSGIYELMMKRKKT